MVCTRGLSACAGEAWLRNSKAGKAAATQRSMDVEKTMMGGGDEVFRGVEGSLDSFQIKQAGG
jgi:hypothetical protein